jgi:Tol biopolymer transport system component
MKRGCMKRITAAFLIITAIFALASPASAINKIRWKEYQWEIYKTEHFRIHYYKGEELLAKLTSIYAEEAYNHDSAVENCRPKNPIPLFIYETHDDFTSTNITMDTLDEGTGGFTEPYKDRVVLPGTGSLKLLKQVVTHEIAHAVQFAIIYGEGMRNYNIVYKSLFLPTWVMEGLAEYCADDMDSQGEMVLRDAIIHDRFLSIDQLDSFTSLEEVYLGYKEAQSVMMYISKMYGKDFIPQFMQAIGEEFSADGVFKKYAKKDYNDFKKEWEYYMKKKYWAQVQGRDTPDKYGPQLTKSRHESPIYDEGPVFSPDGSQIAFISSRGGFRAVYIMANDGKDAHRVFSGFDTIDVTGCPLSWSSDAKTLYFTVSDKGKRFIVKGDIASGSTEEISPDNMYQVFSPAISPDDRYIAFVGSEGGFSDIYVYDTVEKKTVNITKNIYENGYPNWSPDGKYLVFTEEREGSDCIVLYDLKQGKKTFLTPGITYDCRYTKFMNNNEIIYTSDRNGIFNLYSMNINTKAEKQLTNIIGAVFTPSYSPDGFIVYSYYDDACYNIYKFMVDTKRDFEKIPLVYDEEFAKKIEEKKEVKSPAAAPEVTVKAPEQGDDGSFVSSINSQADKVITGNEDYHTSLSPDLLFALFGYGTDTGLVGGGYITLSDMLGDHNLALLADYVPGYYSEFDLQYLFLALPFDVSFDLTYSQNVYQLYDTSTDLFFSQLNSTDYGGSVSFKYPLDLYTSITLILESNRIMDTYTNLNTDSTVVFDGQNTTDIVNTAAIMLQYDHAAWRDLWPYSGEEVSLYLETSDKIFGGTQTYSMYQADLRKYFDLPFFPGRNLNASFRLMLAMTDGPDRPGFLFGGTDTIRGLSYGEYTGDKIGVLNSELRYSLVRNADFKVWPFTFIMLKNIKIALFDDAGMVNDGTVTEFDSSDIKNGLGMSLVLDTFLFQDQYTPLKLELAKRTDTANDIWNFYFTINTAF